jgi:ABC-2 type transport system ATP-binding protein
LARDTSAAVSLRGVRKNFGAVEAAKGIDLDIRPGEVVAFVGPNGAGKTTTSDMVLGLSKPTSGSVAVLGMDPRKAVSHGLVAAVMQSGGLLKDLTVGETALLMASLFSHARPVDEVLDRAGVSAIAGRQVDKCSGGEQQRLRFALALLSDPELLILDEPTTGMDGEGRRSFWNAVREDAEQGRTVLFATHYLEEADAYADRIVLVRQGEIVADGTPAEIKSSAAGRTVRATWPSANEVAAALHVDHAGLPFLIFGLNDSYANLKAGHGNVSAYIMINMALYGAILATASGGGRCRSSGHWAGADSCA